MLVDHFIKFKGCKHHRPVLDNTAMGMEEFIHDRYELLETIPDFEDPEFAKGENLPVEARLVGEPDDMNETEWKQWSSKPFHHMTIHQWKDCCESIGRLFTGGDDSDDEDGVRMDRYLKLGKGDLVFSGRRTKREMARGEASLDIDSILALFTDLSMIKTGIEISIVSNPMKNLKSSVHLVHKGVPLHWIPHFYLGMFGHNPTFDLFIFLPESYDKSLKRRKNCLFNRVPEQLRAEFMDVCFLPAVKEALDPNRSQKWDFHYSLSKAKSNAVGIEGRYVKSRGTSFTQQLTFNLMEDHIPEVWNICHTRLRREIRRDGHLRAFKGFQFFINSKDYKDRTSTTGFSELMVTYKEKVKRSWNFN